MILIKLCSDVRSLFLPSFFGVHETWPEGWCSAYFRYLCDSSLFVFAECCDDMLHAKYNGRSGTPWFLIVFHKSYSASRVTFSRSANDWNAFNSFLLCSYGCRTDSAISCFANSPPLLPSQCQFNDNPFVVGARIVCFWYALHFQPYHFTDWVLCLSLALVHLNAVKCVVWTFSRDCESLLKYEIDGCMMCVVLRVWFYCVIFACVCIWFLPLEATVCVCRDENFTTASTMGGLLRHDWMKLWSASVRDIVPSFSVCIFCVGVVAGGVTKAFTVKVFVNTS